MYTTNFSLTLDATLVQHRVASPRSSRAPAQGGISFRKENTLQTKAATLLMRTTGISSLLWPFHLTTKEARKAHDQRPASKEHLLLKTVHYQSID